ncbi:MAG: baseplate J/gp47 family protein [Oscillospiraceae bacterium]
MKDQKQIYEEMRNELAQKTGLAINDGGDMALRLSAVAAELESLWLQTEWTKKQCFPQTASGEYLDRHAALRGLSRGAAVCSEGVLRFETDEVREQALTIAKGTVCLTAAGVEFLTTETAEIAAGELFCTVKARARSAGVAGNVPSESVTFMALAPVGVERCFNEAAFTGGSDGEDDEALRARVMESFLRLPNGSNRAYYETVALETPGVAAAAAISRARGLGTVDVILAGDSGVPDEEVIASVQSRLEAEREICVDIEVKAPAIVTVPVSVAIEVSEETDFEETAERVRAALEGYFDGRLLGKRVLRAKLGNVVFGVEGVENYSILLPAADVDICQSELPVAGTVTVVGG